MYNTVYNVNSPTKTEMTLSAQGVLKVRMYRKLSAELSDLLNLLLIVAKCCMNGCMRAIHMTHGSDPGDGA